MTTAAQVKKMQAERSHQTDVDRDVLRQLYRDEEEVAQINSEERVQAKRLLRAQQQMDMENEMQESLFRAERDRMVKEQQAAQEEKLAQELEWRKLEEMRDEKARQHIRETSYEIRELESKLKAAYTSKERAAQIARKNAVLAEQSNQDSEMAAKMREANERAAQEAHECEIARYKEKVRYHQELERQLEEQEMKKQQAYQEFLKEKLMIDEIVRKIYEEDQRELESQMKKQRMTKEYMDEFLKAREVWKEREREKMEEENRKIQAYAKLQKIRENAYSSAKQEREEAMNRVREALSESIAQKERDRQEVEAMRQELCQEEEEAKVREQQRTETERRLKERLELKETHDREMYLKGLKLQAEKEEAEQFTQQMLAKLAEDERLEQLNEQKRRMKRLEHKRAVEALLEERRVQFAAEREREVLERAAEQKLEENRKRMVEEERRKLLKEHAVKLLGHLPRGVIQDEEDLEMLGPDFAEAYRCRQLDPFDETLWE